jgi:AmmeMemoRadiSam system protein B
MPTEHEGETLVVLNDRQGIATEPIAVHASVMPFLQLFDGKHTYLDLQAAFTRAAGQVVPSADVEEFVRRFDSALLLDTEHYQAERDRVVSTLREDTHRRPTHADRVYPARPRELRALLDARGREHAGEISPISGAGLRALVAPHIDYERGARCYARVYRHLEDGEMGEAGEAAPTGADEPDVYVLLGTCHSGLESLFSLLPKPFDTPLGVVPLDRELAGEIADVFGEPSAHDLLAHRSEHSLELTATYLAYALGERQTPILPILCGVGFTELSEGGDAARTAVGRYLDALRNGLDRLERRPCFVAGADLAHVGPQFGDSQPLSPSFLADVESCDRRALERAVAGDAEGFAAAIIEVEDRYRVCGLGAIYSLLRLLDDGGGVRGELIDYQQAADPGGGQCVTFAGLVYRDDQLDGG